MLGLAVGMPEYHVLDCIAPRDSAAGDVAHREFSIIHLVIKIINGVTLGRQGETDSV